MYSLMPPKQEWDAMGLRIIGIHKKELKLNYGIKKKGIVLHEYVDMLRYYYQHLDHRSRKPLHLFSG